VIVPPTSNAVGLVQEIFPVAQRRLRILVYRDDDGLGVVEAVSFARRQKTDLASALIHGGLSALLSYHLGGSRDILQLPLHQPLSLFDEQHKVSLHPHQPQRRGRAVDVGRDQFPKLAAAHTAAAERCFD
jgi:hypothetical protein